MASATGWPMPDHDWGRHSWRGRGGWGDGQRPRWWPEGEPWPPQGPEGWRHVRRRFMGRVAAFAIVALTVLALLATLLVCAIGSVLGSSTSSVIGGIVVLLLVVPVARSLVLGLRGSAVPIADLQEAARPV